MSVSLRDVVLKTEYRTLKDDIAREFYIPVLKEAVTYKRAVGFFFIVHIGHDYRWTLRIV